MTVGEYSSLVLRSYGATLFRNPKGLLYASFIRNERGIYNDEVKKNTPCSGVVSKEWYWSVGCVPLCCEGIPIVSVKVFRYVVREGQFSV